MITIEDMTGKVDESVMTPQHPRWCEFGVKMQEAISPYGPWDHTTGTAVEILNTMEGIDIPASLEYFEQHGGYDDVEIIMNVIIPSAEFIE